MRVVNWVHDTASHLWTTTFPAFAAGFAKASIADIAIANSTDRGVTLTTN
jgi:hypothetical protein